MSEFNIRINLTLSKIMGAIGILAGCYGFITGIDPIHSISLAGLGYAAIGAKQYFNNKATK